MRRRDPLQNITTSGGLLTADFIQFVSEDTFKHDKISPKSFSQPNFEYNNPKELDELISVAWEKLKALWDEISLGLKDLGLKEAQKLWIIPLLRALGFNPVYLSQNASLEDNSIIIYLSHRGWREDDALMIHTVSPHQLLDESSPKDRNDRNPHDSLQLYLNLTKKELNWGLMTNGVLLRLLRKFHHTYTRGYIEFDLENIFYERNFTDFRTLYRLAHASRFRKQNGTIPIEQFYEESVAAGVRIGEDLRENVKKAIELLGNGLLNQKTREELSQDEDQTRIYYQELLRIIYRILFIMFAEQRGMLPMHNSLYAEEYSIARLREKSESRILGDTHFDLWYGLKATFTLISEGSEELGVFGYNGELFDDSLLSLISSLECRNEILLRVMRYLTCYQKGKVLQRINFLDIGVEEIGSIYESLLDYSPRVLKIAETIDGHHYSSGKFVLDPRGAARKATGSYYTDKRLIDELIDSTLKPLVDGILNNSEFSKEEKIKAILNIKACDPACGSGAFLIALNNFLGKKLTQIRTGEEIPSEKEERLARRDILRYCIYAVDLNPMAIELAKVSLWINGAVEDLPLNFLDHHFKSGNSILGTFPASIKDGIPDEAFKAINGENSEIASQLRKINKTQKESKITIIDKFLFEPKTQVKISEFNELRHVPEKTKEDVVFKRRRYRELIKSEGYNSQKQLYDTWLSCYVWSFTNEWKNAPTQAILNLISDGSLYAVDSKVLTKISTLSDKYSFFHWYLEFPDVFSGNDPGFDVIIGNPPFISYHGRNIVNIDKKELNFYKSNFTTLAKSRPNSYIFFLENVMKNLLRKNGILGFVIDHTFGDLPSYKSARIKLLRSFSILSYVTSINFQSASVDVSLITIKRKKPRNDQKLIWVENPFQKNEIRIEIPQRFFINNPNYAIFFSENRELVDKIKDSKALLGEITKVSCGLEYGALLKTYFLASVRKSNFYKALDGSEGIPTKYFLRWIDKKNNSYVRYDKEFEAGLNKEGKNISKTGKKVILISGNKQRFMNKKIILRQTSSIFCGVLDEESHFTLRNMHLIQLNDKSYSLEYILGIINSKMADWFGKEDLIIRAKGENRIPQIRVNDLNRLPIMQSKSSNESKIHLNDLIKMEKSSSMRNVSKELRADEIRYLIEEGVKRLTNLGKTLGKYHSTISALLIGDKKDIWGNFKVEKLIDELLTKDQSEINDFISNNSKLKKFNISLDQEFSIKFKQMKNDFYKNLNIMETISKVIDSLVYVLYGLTEKEISIIENNISK